MDRELLYLTALAIAATVASIAILAGIINYIGPGGDADNRFASSGSELSAHNVDTQNITADHDGISPLSIAGNNSLKIIGGVYPVFY